VVDSEQTRKEVAVAMAMTRGLVSVLEAPNVMVVQTVAVEWLLKAGGIGTGEALGSYGLAEHPSSAPIL
jgi:hypothetical protein